MKDTITAGYSFVSPDPQTTLHHQIRKVSVRNGGLPSLYTTQWGEDQAVKYDADDLVPNMTGKLKGNNLGDFGYIQK